MIFRLIVAIILAPLLKYLISSLLEFNILKVLLFFIEQLLITYFIDMYELIGQS